MYRITDVVKNLLIINVALYLATTFLFPNLYPMFIMYYPTLEEFMPIQLVTHMFMHDNSGGLFSMHLIFNMIALFFFGPPLEALWGPKKFLFFYLFCGFGALALHLFVNWIEILYLGGRPGAMLGASGAIFGLLAGFALNYPNSIISLIFPPISLKAKYFVLIYAGLELFLGLGRFSTGMAHFAHLGGALFGLLLIFYWRKY